MSNINNTNDTNIYKNKAEETIKRQKALERGVKYLELCQNGKLIKNKALNKTINSPKISVVKPVFNCKSAIEASIRSIQNQDMTDFEIILVEDSSNDKNETISKIKKLKNEDNRIKIIYNKKIWGHYIQDV